MTRKAPAAALLQDFYMDDVLTGSHTLKQAIKLRNELSELLGAARFPLRKWRASDTRILQGLSQEIEEDSLLVLDDAVPSKTLGLLWDSSKDQLQYSVSLTDSNQNTKRSILSQIARIYDPLGLIGPVLIVAKIIMQNLWKLDVGWDDPVPPAFYEAWSNYYASLETLNQFRISRNFNPQNSKQSFTLHGFGDASEKAYGASIYCVYETKQGERKSYLMCSKAKVAPLKTISLPKLELCAALILARLLAAVIKAMKHTIKDVHLWSDSTIVLCWLDTLPHKLKTYYANRVTEIHELIPEAKWHHVPSAQNPADMLSRGTTVDQLRSNSLWWHGPTWLAHEDQWPKPIANVPTAKIELRKENVFVAAESRQDVLQRYSSFSKLKRIIAYCLRFRDILSNQRNFNALNPEELKRAELIISRMVQAERFPREACSLQQGKEVPANSQLAALNPFLDEAGVIRVRGRLKHADLPYNQRHPIVLPARHHITEILLRQEHIKLHHCGPQQLLADIRTRYWPLSGRREARKIVRRCISCFRYRPSIPKLKMADLPAFRVTTDIRPFSVCGIDFAGPFSLRESKRRGNLPISKAYVAVFVCFKTKAVHLELVSSLSTEDFMSAFRRFCARRGTCSHVYSDNGTNLVGAANELKEIYEFLKTQESCIATRLATQNIKWHFIPPRSPHFGGLWETAVKSVKRHL
ncbi:PREDICTED: uncharacterized protein LOC108769043 [Trachymyrmex cornetzi]|uniref:uncharacterized protein LOC108769043 n=1 Tax=Trachymyrmex cornetzi TaxID=471704 RepID=UPI00084F0AD0|nr:PREDICTED: uncharacterized protein LOC108769043 [Trachymyrmex cornetzi]